MFSITAFIVCSGAMLVESGSAQVPGLIGQLGSNVFAEREAAGKALETIGEPALEGLRSAANGSDDLEIRTRAKRLVRLIEERLEEEKVKSIMSSNLSPTEKGGKLMVLVKGGMTPEQLSRLLGMPPLAAGSMRLSYTAFYPTCEIGIIHKSGGPVSVRGPDETK